MRSQFSKLLFSFFIISLFKFSPALSQFDGNIENENLFYLDVIVFKGQPEPMGRIDFYVAVPYENLIFTYSGNTYAANYEITMELVDSTGKVIKVHNTNKIVREDNYFITQGGTAAADFSQKVFMVPPGKYTARALIRDKIQNREYTKSRSINVINFNEYPFSISGILLLSSIEEKNGRYNITPYIAENIANLPDNFFAFFEIYNQTDLKEANFAYEIIDKDSEEVYFKGPVVTKDLKNNTSQGFIAIKKPELLKSGKYILRIIALKPGIEEYTEDSYLAVAQRTIQYTQTLEGIVLQDLDKAIDQLQYVATSKEMKFISEATNPEEKLIRFEEFWQKKDPSSGTKRNEAFNEYYSRIQKANQAFGTYTEGWMTDRGMVYIIFGTPYNIERGRSYSDGSTYERWVYMNNREFVFADQSGFGDFRLVQPYAISERYTYRR